MKTLYVVELDGVPIEVFSNLEAAKRIAKERTTAASTIAKARKARVAVMRHWYYDDETTDIQLEFLFPEESVSNERQDSTPEPQGSPTEGAESDSGCSNALTREPCRCG